MEVDSVIDYYDDLNNWTQNNQDLIISQGINNINLNNQLNNYQKKYKIIGSINMGHNACYRNSFMQLLLYTNPIVNLLSRNPNIWNTN